VDLPADPSAHIYDDPPGKAWSWILRSFRQHFEIMALLRYTAVAALAASVRGFAIAPTIGAIPSQTIGVGQPFFDIMPTEAPSPELLKKRLEKKAVTNVCSEWTILGGQLSIRKLKASSADRVFQ
jgi:hypothetical protein